MTGVIYWVLAGVLMISADQLTKYIAVAKLAGKSGIEIIPNILEFYYTTNNGAAFSSFAGRRLLLIVMPIIMMVVLVVFLRKTKNKSFIIKLTVLMIIAGGIGNLIDRIAYGYVVDFINFTFIEFPIFNVADIFVTVGGVILVVYLIFFSDSLNEGDTKK